PVCELLALLPIHLAGQVSGSPPDFASTTVTRLDGNRIGVSVATFACRYRGVKGAQIIVRPSEGRSGIDSRELSCRRRDLLTELPNRTDFRERLAAAIARAARSRSTIGVMVLDLDLFSRVNAEHGHAAGDALLQGVAKRLQETKRGGDALARIGGDQ